MFLERRQTQQHRRQLPYLSPREAFSKLVLYPNRSVYGCIPPEQYRSLTELIGSPSEIPVGRRSGISCPFDDNIFKITQNIDSFGMPPQRDSSLRFSYLYGDILIHPAGSILFGAILNQPVIEFSLWRGSEPRAVEEERRRQQLKREVIEDHYYSVFDREHGNSYGKYTRFRRKRVA